LPLGPPAAIFRAHAPPAKSAFRPKSGRLSRAHKSPDLRDQGTAEFQSKRAYLINGSDPQLAATTSGILLANEMITQEQHTAALRYAWAHALTFGRPWNQACPLAGPGGGTIPSDRQLEVAKEQLDTWNARLNPAQRLAVSNVAVFGQLPMWFVAERHKLRVMPQDARDRAALLSGLDAIAGATS
jgi:hypothetical protein